jgi:hypothetical protein
MHNAVILPLAKEDIREYVIIQPKLSKSGKYE